MFLKSVWRKPNIKGNYWIAIRNLKIENWIVLKIKFKVSFFVNFAIIEKTHLLQRSTNTTCKF